MPPHTQTMLKCCRGSLTLLGPLQELEGHLVPTGQRRILLQSGQHWSGTPLLLATRVCGPDWMTAMMTQSFLWAACFSKVTALPPHPWIDLREMLSGLAARYSSLVACWKGDALLEPQSFPQWRIQWADTVHFIIFYFSANHILDFFVWLTVLRYSA